MNKKKNNQFEEINDKKISRQRGRVSKIPILMATAIVRVSVEPKISSFCFVVPKTLHVFYARQSKKADLSFC